MDEVARSCYQQGPLLLEYRRESLDELVNESSNAAADKMDSKIKEMEGNTVHVDYSSKRKKLINNPSDSHQQLLHTENSTRHRKDSVNCLKDNRKERILDTERITGREKRSINAFISEKNVERRGADSSTEDPAELHEQIIYLDDIQEFDSAEKKDVNLQDQRIFMFKAPFVPLRLKIDTGSKFEGIGKERSKSSRKNRTISGKRMRRRSGSIVSDTESTIYYGDLRESSPDSKPKRQNRRRRSRKSSVDESRKSHCTFAHEKKDQPCYVKLRGTMTFVKCVNYHSSSNETMENHCSLEHPCYYWITDEKGNEESPLRVPRRRVKTRKDFESTRDHSVKHDTEEVSKSQETCNSTVSLTPRMTYQKARNENEAFHLRAMTMPIERPKDSITDNFLRSSSFPVQEPGSGSSGNRHVHPKLPDYDEIAATFLALKKEKLQEKC